MKRCQILVNHAHSFRHTVVCDKACGAEQSAKYYQEFNFGVTATILVNSVTEILDEKFLTI